MSDTTIPHVVNEEHVVLGHKAISLARGLLREALAMLAACSLASGFWVTLVLYLVFSLIMWAIDYFVGAKLQAKLPIARVEAVGRVVETSTHWMSSLFAKKAVA